MSQDLDQFVSTMINEVLTLRTTVQWPSLEAGPSELLHFLLDIRKRQDRVEEIFSSVVRLRSRAQRVSSIADAVVEDAWDKAAVKRRGAGVQRGDEFSSARERHAEANLDVLDLRHAARQAAQQAQLADEAVDVIRLAHRGLDGVRQDVLTVLRALQFETHLER